MSRKAKDDAHAMYVLGAICTVRDGASLKTALVELLPRAEAVTIDARAVERIDTAALQLLCAFVRDRRAQGRATKWIGEPEAFVEATRVLGLRSLLGLSASEVSGASA